MDPIVVAGLTKTFGDVLAVEDVSFTVESGEVFGFLGPNGAGKTTTIRTLLGFLAPSTGTAHVLGADVRDQSEMIAAKRRVGYLPADLGFDEAVTGRRILDYHASMKGDDRREALLDRFSPPLDRPVREYSTGNVRMLGIVQAFMHDPDLVIMDEPTAGLDPLMQETFNEFVRSERDRGKTLFLSSHVLSEVRRICDRVGVLRDGRLVGLESVDELLDRGGKRVHVALADGHPDDLLALDGVVDVTRFDGAVQFLYTGSYDELLATLATHPVREIEIGEPPLEDVFMHYYDAEGEVPVDA